MTSRLMDINFKYIPSAKTDVLKTMEKFGFMPPSKDPRSQEKWTRVRNAASINEVKREN